MSSAYLCVLTLQTLGPFLIFIALPEVKIQKVEENDTLFLVRSLKECFPMITSTTATQSYRTILLKHHQCFQMVRRGCVSLWAEAPPISPLQYPSLKLRSGDGPTSSSGLYFPSLLPRMLINEGNELLSYIYYRYICKCLIHTRSLHDTYGNLGSENLGDLLKVTKLVISGFGVNLGLIPKKPMLLGEEL